MKTYLLSALLLGSALGQLCAQITEPSSDRTVVVGDPAQPVQWNHRATIQDAINKAQPNGTVIIPSNYPGTDCNPVSICNPGSVTVLDWRSGGGASGIAGGDLGGNYPSPMVLNIGNVNSGILYLGGLNNGAPGAGQIPYVNVAGTQLSWLAPGTPGCYLTVNGSSIPTWDTNLCFAAGNLTVNGTVTAVKFIGTGPYYENTVVAGGAPALPGAGRSAWAINTDSNFYISKSNAAFGQVPFFAGQSAADQVIVGSGPGTVQTDTLADCQDATGNHLNYTQSTHLFLCGTSAPANSVTGSGTSGTVPKWTGTNTTGNSNLIETANGLQPHENVDLQGNQLTLEGATAGASYNAGTLACVTASNTIANCPSGSANLAFVGVLVAKNGSLPQFAEAGITNVTSHASASFTQGDYVCTDAANGGNVTDNGTTQCGAGTKQVGIVYTTDTTVFSHAIILAR